jgi:hypothetical protein
MRAILVWMCLAAIAAGADLALIPPSGPIEPREYAQISVYGVADRDLAGARVEWSPRDGTTLIPARLWGGQPFLWFSARQPGKYSVTITIHGWRQTLDQAAAEMGAAGVDDAAAGRLRDLAQDMATRYPTARATCVLEVAGGPPPEPPPAPDPAPPATTARSLVILRESGSTTSGQASLYRQLRTDSTWLTTLETGGHRLEILDPDSKDKAGSVPEVVARCLAYPGRPELPAVFVLELSDGGPGRVLSAKPLPASVAEFGGLLQ